MILETFNLTKSYGSKIGCEKICLSINGGQIFGFLGPNGAGKSTLVKMLVGLLTPTSGSAKILGFPLGSIEARKKIGFLPENFRYQSWLSGEELLFLHASLAKMTSAQKRERIPAVLKLVGLWGKEYQKVGSYSKGMQQRIGLACALLPDPELLFLDEPSSALDPLGRREVREIMLELRERGKTVFLNSHLLSEVEMICDRVEIINDGHILLGGTLEELLTKTTEVDIVVEGMTDALYSALSDLSQSIRPDRQHIELTLKNRSDIPRIAAEVVKHGGELYSLAARHTSLEDLYVTLIQGRGRTGVNYRTPYFKRSRSTPNSPCDAPANDSILSTLWHRRPLCLSKYVRQLNTTSYDYSPISFLRAILWEFSHFFFSHHVLGRSGLFRNRERHDASYRTPPDSTCRDFTRKIPWICCFAHDLCNSLLWHGDGHSSTNYGSSCSAEVWYSSALCLPTVGTSRGDPLRNNVSSHLS